MTGADTTSAVDTFFPVKLHDPVHKLHSINGTDFHNAALLTSAAHILIKVWNELTDNTQIIQVRFHTVVWTSAHCDFKFVRQFYIMPVYIKLIMDLFGKSKGIQKAILAGGSFTGYYRAHFRTGTACVQPAFLDIGTKLINFLIWDSLNFHGKTCGVCHPAVAEQFCCLTNTYLLFCCNFSVLGYDPGGKIIRSLVVQKAQGLYSFLIFFAHC